MPTHLPGITDSSSDKGATALRDTPWGDPELNPKPPKARNLILVQHSPVAGFQHHAGEQIWPRAKPGQTLRLKREPDNKHDGRAVAVYWQQHKLGYLPRVENTAVAQMLDRGERLTARIARLEKSADPWKRMSVAVWLQV